MQLFSNLPTPECTIIENRKAYTEIPLVTLQDFLYDRHNSAIGALIYIRVLIVYLEWADKMYVHAWVLRFDHLDVFETLT